MAQAVLDQVLRGSLRIVVLVMATCVPVASPTPAALKADAILSEVCRAAALAAHAGAGVAAKRQGAQEVARLLCCAEALARSAGAVAASLRHAAPGVPDANVGLTVGAAGCAVGETHWEEAASTSQEGQNYN